MPSEPTGRLAGRLSAALYLLCGSLLVVVVSFLPMAPAADRSGLLAVAIGALGMGCVIGAIPWQRWPRSATLWLLPPTFVTIALHNQFVGGDGYRFAPFFYVTFAWIGLCHRRGMSACWTPAAAFVYLVPMWTTHHWTAVNVWSIAYVLPSCVLLGEAIGWVSERLARTQASLADASAAIASCSPRTRSRCGVFDAASVAVRRGERRGGRRTTGTNPTSSSRCALTDVLADRAAVEAVASETHARPRGRGASRRRACHTRTGGSIDVETTSHQIEFDRRRRGARVDPGRDRSESARGAVATPGVPRRAHRAREPFAVRRPGRARARAPPDTATDRSRCRCSTSTVSRRSTTASATRMATSCSWSIAAAAPRQLANRRHRVTLRR